MQCWGGFAVRCAVPTPPPFFWGEGAMALCLIEAGCELSWRVVTLVKGLSRGQIIHLRGARKKYVRWQRRREETRSTVVACALGAKAQSSGRCLVIRAWAVDSTLNHFLWGGCRIQVSSVHCLVFSAECREKREFRSHTWEQARKFPYFPYSSMGMRGTSAMPLPLVQSPPSSSSSPASRRNGRTPSTRMSSGQSYSRAGRGPVYVSFEKSSIRARRVSIATSSPCDPFSRTRYQQSSPKR